MRKQCVTDGCRNDVIYGRGLCRRHYNQAKRDGTLNQYAERKRGKRTRKVRPCKMEGCDRPNNAHGYCQLHARRIRKHGTPGSVGTHQGSERGGHNDPPLEAGRFAPGLAAALALPTEAERVDALLALRQ